MRASSIWRSASTSRDLRGQPLAVGLHRAGGLLLDERHAPPDALEPAQQVGPQAFALGGAHGDKAVHRLVRDRPDRRPDLLLVLRLAAHGEDVGEPREGGEGEVVLEPRLFADLTQRVHIGARQLSVGLDNRVLPLDRQDGDADLHLAAGDLPLHVAFEALLQISVCPGHPRRKFKKPVVDRLDLHRNVPAAQHLLRASVARHAFDHPRPILHVVLACAAAHFRILIFYPISSPLSISGWLHSLSEAQKAAGLSTGGFRETIRRDGPCWPCRRACRRLRTSCSCGTRRIWARPAGTSPS